MRSESCEKCFVYTNYKIILSGFTRVCVCVGGR